MRNIAYYILYAYYNEFVLNVNVLTLNFHLAFQIENLAVLYLFLSLVNIRVEKINFDVMKLSLVLKLTDCPYWGHSFSAYVKFCVSKKWAALCYKRYWKNILESLFFNKTVIHLGIASKFHF